MGFICSKHRSQIPQNRTFRPLQAIARLIAENSLSLLGVIPNVSAQTEPPTQPPRNGGGKGRERRKRNRKHGHKTEAPREERRANEPKAVRKPEAPPADPKPTTAEAPKATAPQGPVVAGGRWRFLVEKLGLPSVVFEMAVRVATKSDGETTFLQALLLAKEGREVLTHCRDIVSLRNPELVVIVRPLLNETWVGWFDRLTCRTERDKQHLIMQLVWRAQGCKALEESGLKHLIATVKNAQARAKRLAWEEEVARWSRQNKKAANDRPPVARAA